MKIGLVRLDTFKVTIQFRSEELCCIGEVENTDFLTLENKLSYISLLSI